MEQEDSTEALQRFWTNMLVNYVHSKKTVLLSMSTTKRIIMAHPARPGTVQLKWDGRTGMLIVKQVHLEGPAVSRGEFSQACEAVLEACDLVKTVRIEAVSHVRHLDMLRERGWKVTLPLTPFTNADIVRNASSF